MFVRILIENDSDNTLHICARVICMAAAAYMYIVYMFGYDMARGCCVKRG